MNELPDWLINLLVQYPVATLNGLVAWYAWKQVRARDTEIQVRADEREKRSDQRNDDVRKDLQASAQKEIERFLSSLKESHDAHLVSKNSEIERLASQFVAELKKIAKKIDDLKKKND